MDYLRDNEIEVAFLSVDLKNAVSLALPNTKIIVLDETLLIIYFSFLRNKHSHNLSQFLEFLH